MILAIDIGNSKIRLAALTDREIFRKYTVPTTDTMPEDADACLTACLAKWGLAGLDFSGGILSSVVPLLTESFRAATAQALCRDILCVDSRMHLGYTVAVDAPDAVGKDRYADLAGAVALYSLPLVTVDLGTATTVSVVDKDGVFRGGLIVPGLGISLDALTARTAQLPPVRLGAAGPLIGANTQAALESGALYGTASMLDGLYARFTAELGSAPSMVLTGGIAPFIAPCCTVPVHPEPDLLLQGLRCLYKWNA